MTHGRNEANVDAVDLLTAQHREVDELWAEAKTSHVGGHHDWAQQQVEELITMLSKHDAIETQLLYPTLRGVGDTGDRLADHSLEEHQKVRELLKEADGRDHREVWRTIEQALTAVQRHAQEEETQIFPLLRRASDTDLCELGDAMRTAWKIAPTHPHPSTPDSAVGAAVVGSIAGVMDRIRDTLKKAS